MNLKIIASLGLAWATLFFWQCSPPPTVFPQGQRVLEGKRPEPPPRPDSLSAELALTFFEGQGRNTVSAALSALPYAKYKLDFSGLFGMLMASFYFEDSSWTLALYEEGVYLRQEGNHIALPHLGVEPLSVHLFFSFLWGHFLPIGEWGAPVEFVSAEADSAAVRVEYAGENWLVLFHSKTGTVSTYVQEERDLRMEFSNYGLMKGRPLPNRARLLREGKPVLAIEVKSVRDNPTWRRSPFFIRIPDSFREVEMRNPEDSPPTSEDSQDPQG